MEGYIKLYRSLLEDHVFSESTPEQKVILVTLLLMANHSGNKWEWKGETYDLSPGQFISSLPKIAEKCGKGITVQNVRTSLKRFEKLGFLTDKSTNKNRLVTIVNWGKYQGSKPELTDKLTGNQQATNRQLTANKNVKNEKNKEEVRSKFKFETHHYKLAELLLREIRKNLPKFKSPNIDDWANTFRLMMERDKREGKEIQDMILFVQQDPFWHKVILSANKLRKQFDRLTAESQSDNVVKFNQPKDNTIHYATREELERIDRGE